MLFARRRLLLAARGAAYRRADRAPVARLPRPIANRLGLPAPGERRVEIGSGLSPRPGYLHVDSVSNLPALDVVAPAHRLPFPTGWCDEIMAVHMLEHVTGVELPDVLAEWQRALRPGGVLTVHTPNGTAIGSVLAGSADVPLPVQWATQAAIFGYDRAPADVTGARDLAVRPDHKLLFTFPLLAAALDAAGFIDITDVSGSDPMCHHTRDWEPFVPGLCLEVRAIRSDAAS